MNTIDNMNSNIIISLTILQRIRIEDLHKYKFILLQLLFLNMWNQIKKIIAIVPKKKIYFLKIR